MTRWDSRLKLSCLGMAVCMLPVLMGCTAKQLYASGQSWQRNECFKLADSMQRDQCLKHTWLSYDQYQHQLRLDAQNPRHGSN